MALDATGGPAGVSDAAQTSVVKTSEPDCRAYPNTKRFHQRVDSRADAVEFVVSSSSTASDPHLGLRTTTGAVVVAPTGASDITTRWRLE